MIGETARRLAWALLIVCAWGCDAPIMQDAGVDAGCSDALCDDGTFCNGIEQCAPGDPAADARGCIVLPRCMASEECNEADRRCVPRDGGVGDAGDGGDCDVDGDGHDAIACDGGDDCDDEDRYRYPGNPERCEGSLSDGREAADHDEDCVPCTVTGTTRDGDADDDLYPSSACTNPWLGGVEPVTCNLNLVRISTADRTVIGADCDDSAPNVRPNQVEVCGNAIDDNCDGSVDEGRFFRDSDNDGRGDPDVEMTGSCAPGWVSNAEDCDDVRSETYLGAPELCDGLDNDCSLGGEMAGGPDASEDMDGDLHSAIDAACLGVGEAGAPTTAFPRDDCDDARAMAHPGANERCDAPGDEDCDGMANESDAIDARDWYVDGDGDGYGAGTPIRACMVLARRVDRAGDCRDDDAEFHPGAGFQPLPYCFGSVCGSPPYFCARNGLTGPCTLLPITTPDWDYDCSGATEYEYTVLSPPFEPSAACTRIAAGVCIGDDYPATDDDPVCGETRSLSTCTWTGTACARTTVEVVVGCR